MREKQRQDRCHDPIALCLLVDSVHSIHSIHSLDSGSLRLINRSFVRAPSQQRSGSMHYAVTDAPVFGVDRLPSAMIRVIMQRPFRQPSPPSHGGLSSAADPRSECHWRSIDTLCQLTA
uniref:Uncharacterized protein n=1 Tax=Anopheles melas TaxID=34690 RepID=A0A182TMV8_9DIPT